MNAKVTLGIPSIIVINHEHKTVKIVKQPVKNPKN